MITLGIETSCDETSFAVLKDGRVLSNVVFSSIKQHKRFGGVVPEIASRSHLEALLPCLDLCMKKARLRLGVVDLIAVTQGPGLMGSLLVGIAAAQALAVALEKPLVGVDHVLAHVYAGFFSEPELRFPFLGLVVSGGHTLLIKMKGPAEFEVLGKTIDDAAGEAFDKVAKILGLEYPGGPEIDRLSRGQDTSRYSFKRPILSKDSLDFSFSGIKTAVYYKVEQLKKSGPLKPKTVKEICAGFQETVCQALVAKSLEAAAAQGLNTVVVGGGVSANTRLRRLFAVAAKIQRLTVVFPRAEYCQDNGAMTAALGAALYASGERHSPELPAYADFLQRHNILRLSLTERRRLKHLSRRAGASAKV